MQRLATTPTQSMHIVHETGDDGIRKGSVAVPWLRGSRPKRNGSSIHGSPNAAYAEPHLLSCSRFGHRYIGSFLDALRQNVNGFLAIRLHYESRYRWLQRAGMLHRGRHRYNYLSPNDYTLKSGIHVSDSFDLSELADSVAAKTVSSCQRVSSRHRQLCGYPQTGLGF